MSCRENQSGFTLVALMAASFLLALSTQQVTQVVSQQAQRNREAELLRIGTEFRKAIGTYHDLSPGSVKEWPPNLDALLNDRRFVSLRRHLRRVYDDPITRTGEWGLIAAPGGHGIMGVYSTSDAEPLRNHVGVLENWQLSPAKRYSDWKFIHVPKPMGSDQSVGRTR